MLTWGLLGPGKGVEWAIRAVALLVGDVELEYVVAGATHPKVRSVAGETYRASLMALADRLGVADRVVFDGSYRTSEDLRDLVCTADVVVLPYDSTEQVTSGVLVDAIAAGRPVVATSFPHARELLATGAGQVVPHRDPAALAAALAELLSVPRRLEQASAEACRLAPQLAWDAVAARFVEVISAAVRLRTVAST